MNYGLRGDGVVEDVDGDCPPQDGRVVGDDDDDDFPIRKGSSLSGIASPYDKSAPAQVSPRDGGAPSRKASPYFFLGQNDLYTKRWAPEVGRGEHNPLGRAWAPWRAQVGCAHLVSPLWYLLAPIFLKYSIKYLHKVLACLEFSKIGGLT